MGCGVGIAFVLSCAGARAVQIGWTGWPFRVRPLSTLGSFATAHRRLIGETAGECTISLFVCADVIFYATSCFVSTASIGVKGWLLGRKLRSRRNIYINNRVGAAPHFTLEGVRRPSLRRNISVTPGAAELQEKFEQTNMKKVKYLMYIAQVRLASLLFVARRPTALCAGVL